MLLINEHVFAQSVDFDRSNFKRKKAELKLAKENIKKGDILLEKAIEDALLLKDVSYMLNQALFFYYQAQDFNPDNSMLNYKIAKCLLFTNNKEKASYHIERARELAGEIPTDAIFYYAMCLQLQYKFDEAIKQFNMFKDNAKAKEYDGYEVLTKKYLSECENGKSIISAPKKVWVDNLSLNSKPQYLPCWL